LKIRISKMIVFVMAVGLLLPAGLGIDVGFIINSSKASLLLILSLILMVYFSGYQIRFQPIYVDWLLFNSIVWLFVGATFSSLLNANGISDVLSFFLSTASWAMAYFSFYFIGRFFPRKNISVNIIMSGLLTILSACALIGIIESIFQTNLYGEFGRLVGLHDAGSGTELWRGAFYRARSSLDQPIAFGFAMTIGYVLTNYLIKIQRLSWGNVFEFLFIITTFLSGSRSSILTLLVCITVINYSSLGRWGKWLITAGFMVTLFWVGSNLDNWFYTDESFLAGEDTAVGQSGNLIGRVRDFEFIQHVMEVTPYFGLTSGMLHDTQAFHHFYPLLANDYDDALDNMVLAILVENGVLGLFMAIISILAIVRYSYFLKECPERRLLMLLVFIFFAASISYDLFVFPGTARLLLLLIALGISATQLNKFTIKRSSY
jgi:O-Antigen ligase